MAVLLPMAEKFKKDEEVLFHTTLDANVARILEGKQALLLLLLKQIWRCRGRG